MQYYLYPTVLYSAIDRLAYMTPCVFVAILHGQRSNNTLFLGELAVIVPLGGGGTRGRMRHAEEDVECKRVKRETIEPLQFFC